MSVLLLESPAVYTKESFAFVLQFFGEAGIPLITAPVQVCTPYLFGISL